MKAIPFARVPVNELWTAKRVLDAGVLGVMFPFTSTAKLAQQAVAACKYPPAGRRGSGAGLASFRWPPADQWSIKRLMKAILIVWVSMLCFGAALRADECCEEKSVKVEQKMREIDLNIAFKQYEQIRIEAAKAELQLAMAGLDENPSAEQKRELNQMERRVRLLQELAERTKIQITEMAKPMAAVTK